MKNDTGGRTAITRRKPSAPARWLFENKDLSGRILDYGCGRGTDADHYGLEKYDPAHFPKRPKNKFHCILCTYVLNVVDLSTQLDILLDIMHLLRKDGVAYITVRRDIPREGTPTQRWVHLFGYTVVRKVSGAYVTYEMRKP